MDFSQVKLKKVQTVEVRAPSLVLCATSDDYTSLMTETYMEQYMNVMKPWTFKTSFVALSQGALEAITSAHKSFLSDPTTRYKYQEDTDLKKLADDMNVAKEEMGVQGIFVRLSSRSPKDAALLLPGFEPLYESELRAVKEENTQLYAADPSLPHTSETNASLHALYRASTVGLMVKDGLSAIDLLVTSKRIQGDLDAALELLKQNPQAPPFNVVVREFKYFDVKYEFSGFVYAKQLTALTQYNELVYFPVLSLQKDKIVQVITDFFHNEIIPKLGTLQNYVIDFILVENGTGGFHVYIVELNPFAEFAGGGLFSWVADLDLLVGKKPFEFRLVTKPVDDFTLKTIYNDYGKYL